MRPGWRLSDGLSTKNETLMINSAYQEFHINGHEAELDCATEPHNKLGKSICDSVKNELFLIKRNGNKAVV